MPSNGRLNRRPSGTNMTPAPPAHPHQCPWLARRGMAGPYPKPAFGAGGCWGWAHQARCHHAHPLGQPSGGTMVHPMGPTNNPTTNLGWRPPGSGPHVAQELPQGICHQKSPNFGLCQGTLGVAGCLANSL